MFNKSGRLAFKGPEMSQAECDDLCGAAIGFDLKSIRHLRIMKNRTIPMMTTDIADMRATVTTTAMIVVELPLSLPLLESLAVGVVATVALVVAATDAVLVDVGEVLQSLQLQVSGAMQV